MITNRVCYILPDNSRSRGQELEDVGLDGILVSLCDLEVGRGRLVLVPVALDGVLEVD